VRRRPAFTLVEIVVALALSGLVLTGVGAVVSAAQDVRTRVARSVVEHEREFVEVAWLEATLARVDRAGGLNLFHGSEHFAQFPTTCARAGGWTAPCRATLRLLPDTSGTLRLTADVDGETRLDRRGMARGVRFAYHNSGADGGTWMPAWAAGSVAPSAMALVRGGDTLRWPIGALP
jgi:prepilin-type N-terminal cleavage/methylation domain-containing protein